VAEKSYFFNDVNDDRVYLAEDFALFFSTLISNGVFPNPSTNTQVLINEETPMTITIKPGFAWINGYLYWNPDNLVKTLAAAYTNPRIDRVVIRWSSNNREILADVINGIPAAAPVAPELTRNSDIWELAIADIWVGANVTMISQANITDTRLSNDLCGIVHGVVDQVDTTTLFNQYQVWFSEKQTQFNSSLVEYAADKQIEIDQLKSDFQTDFTDFMTLIQGALSGDIAGNLLVKINENTAAISQNAEDLTSNALAITALDSRLDLKERLLTTTIPTNGWSGVVPYTIDIVVAGMTDSKPDIVPVFSTDNATAILEAEAWSIIAAKGKIYCDTDLITVTCFEEIPITAINIEMIGG
jgi:hypothetical protein